MVLTPGAGLPRSRKPVVGSTAGAKSRSSWAAMLFGLRLDHEVAELRGLDGEVRAARPGLAQPFVGREEEQLVADDRSAEAVAELVLVELRHRRLEDVLGREVVVLEVVRAAAVERVRAGLGDDLHLRAGAAAVHGREVVRDDADFLDRLGVGRQVGDAAAGDAVGAGVVHGEGVGLVALAAGVDARRRFARERVVGAAAAADRRRHALAGDARLQRDQVVEVAAAERHLLQLHADRPARRRVPARFRPAPRALVTVDRLLHARHFEREVDADRLADADVDRFAQAVREPGLDDLDPVGARAEAEHAEHAVAVVVASRATPLAMFVTHHDRVGDDGLLAVSDGALDGAVELRRGGGGEQPAEKEAREGTWSRRA